MVVSESVEDYLEAILVLQEKNGYVRSVDIANHLELSKASVSIAMKNLKENKFIKITDNHEIRLSETGLELAKSVYEKHLMFSEFFIELGVPKETFDAIKSFVAKHSEELKSKNV